MKDVDGMKKIRNWIRELQNKVAEEQMPPRYRDFTPEQWEECVDVIPTMSDIAHYPYRVTRQMLEEAMEVLKERAVQ